MTDGDFLLGETSRRETVAWLVRFIGWALFASLGAGVVVGVVVASVGVSGGLSFGFGALVGLAVAAFACVTSNGPTASLPDDAEDEDYATR